MHQVLAFGGWACALLAALVALLTSRTSAARMEVVARACHELRNPLAAARLGLRLGTAGPLSESRLRAIDLELSRASLALRDLTDVGCGQCPHPEPFGEVELGELVADSVEAWRGAALSQGADLRLRSAGPRTGVTVLADRVRLAQATGNLIANAIEHGGRNVEVRVRVEAAAARIEVSDDGPGLPAPVAELKRHGGRWPTGGRGGPWRIRGRGGVGRFRGPGGPWRNRGRGLAIACEIAEAHGGRLAAGPTERGARLVLELPAPILEPAVLPGPGGSRPDA